MGCFPCQLQGITPLWEVTDRCSRTNLLLTFSLNKKRQGRTGRTDVTTVSLLSQHSARVIFAVLTLIPHYQYFSFTPSGGAFNHIVLKESTLTYITMLINRTFPFCRRPQRATLSVSVAESPHSLGPIHVFPMLQFTHWIRLGPKKVFQSQLSSGKEKRRSWVGGEILKPFH